MRILFVDNHPEFTATVIVQFLGAHDVVVVATIAAAQERVRAEVFDVVLVDYDLDDGKGDTLVRWLREQPARARLVGVSARDSGNAALVAAGVDAVCKKLEFAQIERALTSA